MAMDLTSVLLGLAGAGLPLLALAWQLQRRASNGQAEVALLEERLAMAQLAQVFHKLTHAFLVNTLTTA